MPLRVLGAMSCESDRATDRVLEAINAGKLEPHEIVRMIEKPLAKISEF